MARTKDTKGLIALVTGANKGIGKEIARQLAQQGVRVIIGARDNERGRAALDDFDREGLDVELVTLDVTSEASAKKAAEVLKEKYGKLDILVNNAGIAMWPQDPLQFDVQAYKAVYDTNVFGAVNMMGAMHELLKASGHGRIVNISSSLGSFSFAKYLDASMIIPAYNTSKTALNALTVTYAKLLAADGIKVNAACPGFTATDINNHSGTRSVAEAAQTPVRLALLADDGPTGGFFNDEGFIEW